MSQAEDIESRRRLAAAQNLLNMRAGITDREAAALAMADLGYDLPPSSPVFDMVVAPTQAQAAAMASSPPPTQPQQAASPFQTAANESPTGIGIQNDSQLSDGFHWTEGGDGSSLF